MSTTHAIAIQIPPEMAQYWGWFLVFGVGLLLLGIAAIVRAFSATIATMLFFGWLLLLAGGIEIAQAFMVGQWAGFFHHLLAAILFGVVGILLVTRPVVSAEGLTLVMAGFFLIGGIFQIVASLAVPLPGWGWHLADGAITTLLGVLLLARWPVSGLWAIGLFVGVDLASFGATWIAFALGLRSL